MALNLTDIDRALSELITEDSPFGPSHIHSPLFGPAAMNANPAQSLDARLASNTHLLSEQASPTDNLFNSFFQDMGSNPYESHSLYSRPTMDPAIRTVGPSYMGPHHGTGQYCGPGGGFSMADAFTSTSGAPHFDFGAQMSSQPFSFPETDLLTGLTGLYSPSNDLQFPNRPVNPHNDIHYSGFTAFMYSAPAAEGPQLGPGLDSATSLAANVPSTQHEVSAIPALRTPSNGQFFSDRRTSNGASYDTVQIQNPSDIFENLFGSGVVSPITGEQGEPHGSTDGQQWSSAQSPEEVDRSCSGSPVQGAPSGSSTPERESSPDLHPTDDPRVLKFDIEARQKFHCYICNETYRGAVIFGAHMKGHGVLKCPTPGCGKQYKRWGELKSHLFTHAKQYACSSCKMPWAFQRDARRHYDSVHSSSVVKCPYAGCPREIHRRDNLRRHMLRCRWKS